MANSNLNAAAKNKNDEFYTQYDDIQREMNCYYLYNKDFLRGKTVLLPCDDPEWSKFTEFFVENFEIYGLKKLISTSYAVNSKKIKYPAQPTLWEAASPQFNADITDSRGKIFTLDQNNYVHGVHHPNKLQWEYLQGDGDFRSDEVKALREEADVIITNPPFSLFREFLKWINPDEKKFLIIGNINCLTYKEVFPLIKENKIWLGPSIHSGDRKFYVPDNYPLEAATCGIDEETGRKFINVKGVRWFTNLEHNYRHEPLRLMTMAQCLRYHPKIKHLEEYQKYDNYDAIEVPATDAIPEDYPGVMGVPITFLDKYCPEQFEIVGMTSGREEFGMKPTKRYQNAIQHNTNGTTGSGSKVNTGPAILFSEKPNGTYYTADNADGFLQILYQRYLIRHKFPDS
ncbi:MAG: adenine-specific methyltransferase EcoRI family protein [Selenomonadaceae bacterium]|nr:adenine-specific methyltransferase EcoRI family protein [Selenomonadaceae bacterium]